MHIPVGMLLDTRDIVSGRWGVNDVDPWEGSCGTDFVQSTVQTIVLSFFSAWLVLYFVILIKISTFIMSKYFRTIS